MMHQPIQFKNLCLSFPHKTCFVDFSGQISYGSRIAIIGRNGSGKSTLLKWLARLLEPSDGDIRFPKELNIGYVPQVIEEFDSLSGGQRFHQLLTQALASDPDLLMLDEPSNHLDRKNRRSLMRMLTDYRKTLIIVTHDIELLQTTVDTIWHIEQAKVHVFTGCYEDYLRKITIARSAIEGEMAELARQKKQIHADMMREQSRARSSRVQGEKHIQQRKWPTIVSQSKARNAQETSGRKKSAINHKKQELTLRLSELYVPEVIYPKFAIHGVETNEDLVTVSNGSVGYDENNPILSGLSFSIKARERIAIHGDNGSGKSTLLKAILDNQSLVKKGTWIVPHAHEIGFLDQHYNTLPPNKTVWEIISCFFRDKSNTEIRKHLNDFLFRKNEEVDALVSTLSGGEKARLSLAQIAAITPKLLILDEMTNNLDRETRAHVIQVLKDYPGAMIVISHDSDFLNAIQITHRYEIKNGLLN
ncbi:ATP-binding cassette domain-containing protein [Fluoribacter gormanii]|uniref:ABC-F family ATP-binding cassette domain-containing protein n=1 Tax=Fluoribacter gormanii TaxID=464 RepID=UPI002242D1E9|nr:ABC-F family ATP-binding cassette domain-containing protein [Fluoribacter gormanii]MCW8471414.1 ATP-binding cassette domain-containing protein [Fluoribacter gormanii]